MKLRYKGQNYCFSTCAKDKYQQFIITPLTWLVTALITLVLTTVVGVLFGELFGAIHLNPILNGFLVIALAASGSVFVLIFNEALDEWTTKDYAYERHMAEYNPTDLGGIFIRTVAVSTVLLIGLPLVGIIGNTLFGVINANPFLAGFVYVIIVALTTAFLMGLLLAGCILYKTVKWFNHKLDRWVNKKYDANRTSCTLLEICHT